MGVKGWLAFDLEVAAQGGLCHIDVFELDFDMVSLYVGPLLADEFAEGPKEGRGEYWFHLHQGSVPMHAFSLGPAMRLTRGSRKPRSDDSGNLMRSCCMGIGLWLCSDLAGGAVVTLEADPVPSPLSMLEEA